MKILLLSNISMLENLLPIAGQVKFHPQSGSRSSLVLRDEPEDTSFWVEERNGEIIYYKNYATNGYLGECYKTFYSRHICIVLSHSLAGHQRYCICCEDTLGIHIFHHTS